MQELFITATVKFLLYTINFNNQVLISGQVGVKALKNFIGEFLFR
jgi:hypothetical protein